MSRPPPDAFDDDELPDDAPGDAAPVPRGPFTRENPLTFIVPEPLLLRLERIEPAAGEVPLGGKERRLGLRK